MGALTRRSLLSALAALPLVGRMVAKAEPEYVGGVDLASTPDFTAALAESPRPCDGDKVDISGVILEYRDGAWRRVGGDGLCVTINGEEVTRDRPYFTDEAAVVSVQFACAKFVAYDTDYRWSEYREPFRLTDEAAVEYLRWRGRDVKPREGEG